MHQSRFRLPLIVAALALAQAVCWGMTFNLPAVTGGAMAEALAVPYVVVMMGPTAMLVVMALIAVPLLQVFQRLGMRLVMTASAAFGAVGLAIVALAMWPWAYFVGWAIIGAAGAGMLTTAVQIAIAEFAGPYARRAIGALMVFGGLGTTLCWPLLGALQAAYGWRAATMFGAAALLLVAAPIYWQLPATRPDDSAAIVKNQADSQFDWTAFGLLAFSTVANGMVTWGFSLTIITLFESRGLEHGTAILIASFIGVAALSARLVDFIASHRWNSLATGMMAAAGLPVSFAILIFGRGELAAGAFAAFYGLTSGVLAVARSTIPLDLFPAAAYARASSMLALPLNLSFACAPPLFAAILAGPGGDVALWISTALSLAALAALALLVLRHRGRLADT